MPDATKMGLSELLNANLSKKMGIGVVAMYLISKCTDTAIANLIAAVAIFAITVQGVIDWRKLTAEKKLTHGSI